MQLLQALLSDNSLGAYWTYPVEGIVKSTFAAGSAQMGPSDLLIRFDCQAFHVRVACAMLLCTLGWTDATGLGYSVSCWTWVQVLHQSLLFMSIKSSQYWVCVRAVGAGPGLRGALVRHGRGVAQGLLPPGTPGPRLCWRGRL